MKPIFLFFLLLASSLPAVEPFSPMILPVHVHLVRSVAYPALHSETRQEDLPALFEEVNRIWSQAGIQFQLVKVTEMTAVDVAPKRLFERSRNWVKSALRQDLLVPGCLDVCIVREMGPNGFFYGEPVVISETPKSTQVRGGSGHPTGRVLAHEFGHVLTLEHRETRSCLMAPGLRGTELNGGEIRAARQQAALLLLHGIP